MVMDNGQIVETRVVGDKLTFSSDAGRVLQNAVLPAFPVRRRTTEKGLTQMQRVTITLDDDLLETLDSLSQRRGYNNRSEAIRDILRSALAQGRPLSSTARKVSRCSPMCMNTKNAT